MWLYFALLSGVFYTIQGLLSRYILKGEKDAWAFSFYFSAVGAATCLPFVFLHPKFSSNPLIWILMLLVGILIVVHNLLNFKSVNYIEASLQGSITKFRLLWILIIGIVFLHESITLTKIAGTILTIIAGITVMYQTHEIKIKTGVVYAFLATVVYALVIGINKSLLNEFNSATLTFLIFIIPAVINFFIMPNATQRILAMAKTQGKEVLLATSFGGFANLAMHQALSIGEASKALVIIEAFLIAVLLGEHFFLKEKTSIVRKIIAVSLATIGAILIRISN